MFEADIEAMFEADFDVECLHLEADFQLERHLEAGQHSWQHFDVAFLAGLWPHFEAGLENLESEVAQQHFWQ